MPRALRIHAALATVALLFSANYVVSKLGLHAFSSMTFAYLRVVGAAIILNLIFISRKAEPLTRDDRRRVVLYSMLGVVINQTLFLGGLALTSAHIAAILMTLIPVFALVAAIVLGRERTSIAKTFGIALALAGALAVVGREGITGADKSLLGDLLLMSNAFAYSLYLVLSKPDMTRLTPQRVITMMFGIGAVIMTPLCAWSMWKEPWRSIPPGAWLALVIVILGPTVAAYLLNAWALAHTESSLVATYTYVQPVLTVVLAAVFLGETIQPVAIVAGGLIFLGIYLARPY